MITQYERKDFFNIPDQLKLSKEEFEHWWKQTDNFWTTARTNKTLKSRYTAVRSVSTNRGDKENDYEPKSGIH